MTPACKSARTLVVPPGVDESLRGEGDGGFNEAEDGLRVSVFGEGEPGARESEVKDESAAVWAEVMVGTIEFEGDDRSLVEWDLLMRGVCWRTGVLALIWPSSARAFAFPGQKKSTNSETNWEGG